MAAKAGARATGPAKLSAERILGPAPGRRTVSDDTIREAVRAVMKGRSTLADA